MSGTQPYLTRGSASTHCVLCLNPIEGTFNIVFLDSHTHTSINLAIKLAFSSQNPNIHLSCNSTHHIQGSKQTYHIQGRNIDTLRLNKQIITSKAKHLQISFIFLKVRLKAYLKQMHVHVNA